MGARCLCRLPPGPSCQQQKETWSGASFSPAGLATQTPRGRGAEGELGLSPEVAVV